MKAITKITPDYSAYLDRHCVVHVHVHDLHYDKSKSSIISSISALRADSKKHRFTHDGSVIIALNSAISKVVT